MAGLSITEGQEKDEKGDVFHDPHTMKKVFDSFDALDIPRPTAEAVVAQMQTLGILFRERGKF